jgi:peptidyl-dipeptidase A
MWAQDWGNLYGLLTPYPNAVAVDVTDEMIKQNWNARKMFEVSEEFYTSLGLEPMPTCYGPLSMIEKPTDGREVVW